MPDLADGESCEMQGSGSKPYILKNVGGVYSCTCPAWRNQSLAIEQRTCKHLRKLRGDEAENVRIGAFGTAPAPPRSAASGAAKEGPPVLLAESWDNVLDLTGWRATAFARKEPSGRRSNSKASSSACQVHRP